MPCFSRKIGVEFFIGKVWFLIFGGFQPQPQPNYNLSRSAPAPVAPRTFSRSFVDDALDDSDDEDEVEV